MHLPPRIFVGVLDEADANSHRTQVVIMLGTILFMSDDCQRRIDTAKPKWTVRSGDLPVWEEDMTDAPEPLAAAVGEQLSCFSKGAFARIPILCSQRGARRYIGRAVMHHEAQAKKLIDLATIILEDEDMLKEAWATSTLWPTEEKDHEVDGHVQAVNEWHEKKR